MYAGCVVASPLLPPPSRRIPPLNVSRLPSGNISQKSSSVIQCALYCQLECAGCIHEYFAVAFAERGQCGILLLPVRTSRNIKDWLCKDAEACLKTLRMQQNSDDEVKQMGLAGSCIDLSIRHLRQLQIQAAPCTMQQAPPAALLQQQ